MAFTGVRDVSKGVCYDVDKPVAMRIEEASFGSSEEESSVGYTSDTASFYDDDAPDLRVIGVRSDEHGWQLAGVVESTDEEFVVRVRVGSELEMSTSSDAVVLCVEGEKFGISMEVADELSQAPDRELLALGNGPEFCDEDGDFDYCSVGMPVSVWRYIYGHAMAPTYIAE